MAVKTRSRARMETMESSEESESSTESCSESTSQATRSQENSVLGEGSLANSVGGGPQVASSIGASVDGRPHRVQSPNPDPETEQNLFTDSPVVEEQPLHGEGSSGYCVFHKREYAKIIPHLKLCHKKEMTPEIAAKYGLQWCACGTFTKVIERHWAQWCKLPKTHKKVIHPNAAIDDDDAGSADSLPTEVGDAPEFKSLYRVLRDDNASEDDICMAYKTLAKLPEVRRLWRPAEVSLLNSCVTRVCTAFLQHRRPVDILRFHAIPKVGCAEFITKGRLGKLRDRLRKFPQLDDVKVFEEKFLELKARTMGVNHRSREDIVHSKLSKGLAGSAFRILNEEHGIAPSSEETFSELERLHPSEEEHLWEVDSSMGHPHIDRHAVQDALRSTSKETSAGPSGVDGLFIHALKHNQTFSEFLWKITKGISRGSQVLPQLFLGSRLIPLKKNSRGGIRPIAVGELLFRICCRAIMRSSTFDLLTSQFGVRSRNGVEPLIHLARIRCSTESILSVDIANAFNSIKRSFVREQMLERAPALVNCYSWAYGRSSMLFVDGVHLLNSSSGVRQGDPLAPLYFCLGYSRILTALNRTLEDKGIIRTMPVMSYLDDTYVFSHRTESEKVHEIVVDTFDEFHAQSGLRLKNEKTWKCDPQRFREEGVNLLGSHIGGKADEFLFSKGDSFQKMCDRLKLLPAQDCFLLLSQCGVSQVTHLMRTMEAEVSVWSRFDESIKETLLTLLRRFEVSEVDTDLISLPMREGGLGLTLPSLVFKQCFDASQAESFKMIENRSHAFVLPTVYDPRRQRVQVKELWEKRKKDFYDRLSDFQSRTFVDNSSKIGSNFLRAFPCSAYSTFSSTEFTSALAYRLLQFGNVCRQCDSTVDEGHTQGCEKAKGLRIGRHEFVKNILAQALKDGGNDVQKEVVAVNNSARRTDIVASGISIGGSIAIDVTCCAINRTTSLGESHGEVGFRKSRLEISKILQARVSKKNKENLGLNYRGVFLPFVLTIGGTLNSEAWKLLEKFKKHHHREYFRLLLDISCVLAKNRGMLWTNCRLAT